MSGDVAAVCLVSAFIGWTAGWLSCWASTGAEPVPALEPIAGPIRPGDVLWLSGRRVAVVDVGELVSYRSILTPNMPCGELSEPLFRDLALREVA